MKSLYLLTMAGIVFTLTSCTATHPSELPRHTPTIPMAPPSVAEKKVIYKNPVGIQVYASGQQPVRPYKVIGTETVSKYNPAGIKRQTAMIHDVMRNLAASIGGDAVIDVHPQDKSLTGKVIIYQNVG